VDIANAILDLHPELYGQVSAGRFLEWGHYVQAEAWWAQARDRVAYGFCGRVTPAKALMADCFATLARLRLATQYHQAASEQTSVGRGWHDRWAADYERLDALFSKTCHEAWTLGAVP
jgi:hypothetical protein